MNRIKKKFSILLVIVILITAQLQVLAAPNLLDVAVRPDATKINTYLNGYKYNTLLRWDYSPIATRGYYLTVTNVNDPNRYYIRETVATTASDTSEEIYGLPPGSYIFKIDSIDSNYKLQHTHNYYYFNIDYSGNCYEIDWFA